MSLVAICEALAGWEFELADGEEIGSWGLREVKNRVSSDHLPRRIILPPGADGGSAIEGWDYVTYARVNVVYRVNELMLFAAVAQRGGLAGVWEKLTEFVDLYLVKVAQNKNLGMTGVHIVQPEVQVGLLEWPRGSREFFHGVQVSLLVREVIC